MDFVKKNVLFDKIVFIDGIGSSGKNILGPILSTYKGVELHRMDTIFEHVGALHHFGKISLEGATTLMKYALDEYLYSGMIGRNVNFRPSDYSCVSQGMNTAKYLERLLNADEGDVIAAKIKKEKPIFQNLTHELLGFSRPCFEAFGDKIHFIEVVRHPVNLVDRWINAGLGENRYNSDARSFVLAIKAGSRAVPYYAREVRSEYHKMKPVDRIISDLSCIYFHVKDYYRALQPKWKKQVMFIKFEDLVTDTRKWLNQISSFVGLKEGPNLEAVMKLQRCPRKLERDGHKALWQVIRKGASRHGIRKLEEMIADFEKLQVENLKSW